MAKSNVSVQDMASKLMGSAAVVAPSTPKKKPEPQVTKRLNLDISIQQWRKLKRIAADQGRTVSDVVRDWIDQL